MEDTLHSTNVVVKNHKDIVIKRNLSDKSEETYIHKKNIFIKRKPNSCLDGTLNFIICGKKLDFETIISNAEISNCRIIIAFGLFY